MDDKQKVTHFFVKELDYYLKHIESLFSTLPLIMKLISATQKTSNESLNKFVDKLPKDKIEEKEGKTLYKIEIDQISRFNSLRDRTITANLSSKIIPRSFLISLISHYDSFISGLIRSLFLICPEKLNSSEKKFTYSELLQFENIEKAKEFIVDREVETILRDSHLEQIEWLENKFDIKLRVDLPSWPQFIEITERRNLFVHCDGKVSQQYINVCKKNNFVFTKEPKIGDILTVNKTYFNTAYEVMFELGVKLTHVFWSKFIPDEKEIAAKNITEITYNLIQKEQYALAIILLEFANKYLRKHKDFDKKVYKINLAQAYKWSGNFEQCKKILEAEDWSACDQVFKMCASVLKDEFQIATDIMKEIGPKEDLVETYQEWPIFKEFRKSVEFLNAYKIVYGKDFVYLDYEDDSILDIKLLKANEEA